MNYINWSDTSNLRIFWIDTVGDKIGDNILTVQLKGSYEWYLYYSTINGRDLTSMSDWIRYETKCSKNEIKEILMCIYEWKLDLKEAFGDE